jgi:hypothetical protein
MGNTANCVLHCTALSSILNLENGEMQMNGWMVAAWAVTAGSLSFLLAATAWIWVERRKSRTRVEESVGFSIGRYLPMQRLLSDDDFTFLASQPGYQRKIGTQWKRERKRIFRLYLNELKADFHRLHADARLMAANADAESSELVAILMRQQIAFWRAIASLEVRLALRAAGIGRIDVAPLLEMLESMRLDLTRVQAPRAI